MEISKEHSRPTQCDRIMKYLERFGSITQLEALRDLGIMRLPSRITELKRKGIEFKKERIKVRTKFDSFTNITQYSLKEKKQ